MANVLKRFIRQLDEPLLTENLKDGFLKTANIEQVRKMTCVNKSLKILLQTDEKLESYRELLNKLPVINYNTLRRLVDIDINRYLV